MNVELVQYEIFAKEVLKRVMAEEEPADLHEWMRSKLAHIGGGDETAGLGWVESFDWYDALLAKREALALLATVSTSQSSPKMVRRASKWRLSMAGVP